MGLTRCYKTEVFLHLFIIMAGYSAHARNGHIFTSGVESDVAIVFPDPDFLKTQKFRLFAYF